MNILFTVCGRAGSKGIRNKNIREFLGYPTCLYTLAAIELFIKRYSEDYNITIALNTDSIELRDIARSYNKNILIVNREDDLTGDYVSKLDVIRDTYCKIILDKTHSFDLVVDLDITSPLRRVQDIKNVIDKINSCKSDVVFTVTSARRNPYFNMVCKNKSSCGYGRVLSSNYNTRQESPVVYDMNASIYAYNTDFLLSKKSIFEGYCEIVNMPDTCVIDLDTEDDFLFMEIIADYLFKNNIQYGEIMRYIDKMVTGDL